MKKNAGKAGKIIIFVIIAILLVGAIGLVIRFTNNGNSVFYVEAGDQTYSKEGEYVLQTGENRFDTWYIYSDGSGNLHGGYSLSVVADEDNDFWFTVDGADEKLSLVEDLSKGFDIVKDKTGFTINYDGSSIEDILSRIYDGKEIVLDDGIDFNSTFVKLVITSGDGKNSVEIGLYLDVHVTGIELDKEGIIF